MMGRISKEEIKGYTNEYGKIICANCMTDEDWSNLTEEQIITREEIENSEDLYFCDDECGEQL